ncbi:hypothetical protein ANO11243_027990 [Dothideomycetidae sp. 11243]|nr:hypothetical protein ANO11243_027990 [fungal sp. No.11243]
MPGAFPQSVSPENDTPTKLARHIANAVAGQTRTPKHKSPRPSDEEMHPQRFQTSTTKPLDEARWLGFSQMAPHTEPPKGVNKWAPAADTPTKITKKSDPQAGPFEFTFRAQSLELSSEARQLMAEKREEAARIKQEMARIEEEQKDVQEVQGRKIAKPKGKTGRFSDVHMAHFKKLDSIANHASASRPNSRDKMEDVPSLKGNPMLKRTGSKAGLKQGQREDEVKQTSAASISSHRNESTTEDKSLRRPSPDEICSPSKRVKLDAPKPAFNAASSVIKVAPPSVMQQSISSSSTSGKISYPSLSTPTRGTLAKSATVRADKTTMIPSLVRTPSKSASKAVSTKPQGAHSSLFARSPTKFAHMSAKKEASRQEQGSPLLARSPIKSIFGSSLKTKSKDGQDGVSDSDRTPLLSRSPARLHKESSTEASEDANKTPLLARSPAKAAGTSNPFAALKSTPGPQANLMDRFKMLRQSPVKSILRTPQRLYSDDPLKIANGTHLATPPAGKHEVFKQGKSGVRVGLVVPATEPVIKHVDFTASTKSNDESPVPSSKSVIPPGSAYPTLPSYPSLPSAHDNKSRSQRRQTLGPLDPKDFTFRVGSGITFGPSPSVSKASPKPSIRHISADPEPPLPSSPNRKRKFIDEEFEADDVFAPAITLSDGPSDKENDANTANIAAGIEAARNTAEGESAPRPSKRVKKSSSSTTTAAAPAVTKTPGSVPSWAQGTAAQKARAALARQHATDKPKRAVARSQTRAPSAPPVVAAGVKAATKPNVAKVKASAPMEGEGKRDRAVLSRARLDALSRPKRRA